ncbi:IclR family transcriptional regulator [Amycolatopsis alkalitolerans]|uniref:hypothetical protein n=1 Tax=Amycolatopsis alkalitolerans TaxID=2547244 RepID=UPI0026C3142B
MSQSLDRGLTALADGADTLEARHFVRREGPRHYRLGSALFDQANGALEGVGIPSAAAPAVAERNARTGHTAHLATCEDHDSLLALQPDLTSTATDASVHSGWTGQ